MPRRLLALLVLACAALAGGGPESTLVVVNGRSPNSRWIANEYRKLRSIPASHLVVLDSVPHDGVVDLAVFREKIWKPIAEHIDRAGLTGSIDLIAYSCDFPYGVGFRKEYGERQPTQDVGGIASLTGVTYLIRQVEAEEEFWSYRRPTNRYFRIGSSQGRQLTGAERNIAMRAQALHKAGKLGDARKLYEEFLAIAPDFGRVWVVYAACLAGLGDVNAAFEALEQAAARGFSQVGMLESEPGLARLRNDARWAPLLEKMTGALPGLRPTRGFSAAHAWNTSGEPEDAADSPHRYFLSVQLAYTGFKGNSVPEVLAYLRASAAADATNPDGTVYICKNGNVRSTARQAFFQPLQDALKARGRKVELLENTQVPPKRADVIGAVVGTAGFDWGKSGSRILPGAICEHLTSFGAHFGTAGQTKITEFLRYGAAGSSGTVMEPLAIHLKFPNPMIHAFYADGCSLAEAFYQSVAAPYQLMVAGDGLCQPFAKPPGFELPVPKQPWSGKVTFEPKGDADFEYWLDGKRVATGPSYLLDADAPWSEFSVVAIAKDRIGARSAKRFDNASEPITVAYGEPIPLGSAKETSVTYGNRNIEIAKVGGKWVVPSELVGPGPVRLVVRADGQESLLDVEVALPEPAPGAKEGEARLGVVGTTKQGAELLVTSMAPRAAGRPLREQLPPRTQLLKAVGAFHVPRAGAYQFNVSGTGGVELRIAGDRVLQGDLGLQRYGFKVLGAGWHPFDLDAEGGAGNVEILLTGEQPGDAVRFGRILEGEVPPPEREESKEGGLELSWKRTPKRKIGGFAVFPAKGGILPAKWVLQARRSRTGKWKNVKELRVLLAPPTQRPAKDKPAIPLAVELRFEPEKVRYFRLVPDGKPSIESVVVTHEVK